MAVSARKLVQGNAAKVASVPAPVGGWNARDSLANMAVTDAVTLTNMFPSISNVVLRGGYTKHSTGITGQVETLMSYAGGATNALFACAVSSIYDVTAGGAVGAAVVTGLTNARWSYTNVATTAANYIYAANGVDAPLLYNGTTWTSITGVSVPAITGVTTTTLTGVILFKNRVWFIEKNTLKAWYLPTSAVGGAAQQLDLSSVAGRGGYIVAIGTWTVDAGYGVDDNLVFVTNKGEVIVYRGSDPASASTWALMGVYSTGAPVGDRCLLKYAGDLLLISLDGLIPLSQAIQSARVDATVALTDKIQGAFVEAVRTYKSNFGWQIVFSAENDALWVNVPISVGSAQQQYVMNTITKAWCNFTGWAANCWETYRDAAYFGSDGFVGLSWSNTYSDNATAIQTNALQAFNYYDARGVKKYFTRARPSIFTTGSPAIFVGMNVDFSTDDVSAALVFNSTTSSLWDTARWSTDLWGSGSVISNTWLGITGLGYCGGINLQSSSIGLPIEWASTDVVYQTGWAGI
ncbi:MAG: hypothetical protein EXR86_16485 [Gammaproteobacteria bacterium]|nr:hypothetical protein [Gammaproteobacteria bacterium]